MYSQVVTYLYLIQHVKVEKIIGSYLGYMLNSLISVDTKSVKDQVKTKISIVRSDTLSLGYMKSPVNTKASRFLDILDVPQSSHPKTCYEVGIEGNALG